MTFEELREQVKEEALHLRQNATEQELAKLNYYELRAADPSSCIYGQMTGWSDSKRAKELKIHVTPCGFSAIEHFLFHETSHNVKALISFLKGETNELIFS